jgi:hypothetical protein
VGLILLYSHRTLLLTVTNLKSWDNNGESVTEALGSVDIFRLVLMLKPVAVKEGHYFK